MNAEFWLGSLNGRDYSEDLGVNGSVILNGFFGHRVRGCGLDLSGSGYRPMVGALMKLRIPQKAGNFPLAECVPASQERLFSME
jgi:hypothetical protein